MEWTTFMEIGPPVYNWFKPYLNMNQRRGELRKLVEELRVLITGLETLASSQEANRPQTRRRHELVTYLQTSNSLANEASTVLAKCEEDGVVTCVRNVSSVEQYVSEAEALVARGMAWNSTELTYNDARADKLPVRDLDLMGHTARVHIESSLVAITADGKHSVGIYGCPGAGKKSIMKHIYNKVLEGHEFKSVFWADAPKNPSDDDYELQLQEKVSDGMWFDITHDMDCVRRASFLEERFVELAALGKVILFMCDLRREFRAYEVLGISESNCVLVFTAPSLDVCNRMNCDVKLKVDYLPKEEAEELFMREAGHPSREIQPVASQIASECARMPLAIRVIANSMRDIPDIHEWRYRLDVLKEKISSIHNEEDRIVELLKFGYTCLEDSTARECFVVAAQVLSEDRKLTKADIIGKWRERNLIGTGWHYDDQGYTIINQLERLCLLEVEPEQTRTRTRTRTGTAGQLVTMNKWIRKIATVVELKSPRNHL